MNILLLGNGGREHSFAWKLAQSPLLKKLFIAEGNAGTATIGTNIAIRPTDFKAIEQFCLSEAINMVIVGPEEPLVKGISDYFRSNDTIKNIPVIGCSQSAARLEGSKAFAKAFMERHNIPTANYKEFTKDTIQEGLNYLSNHKTPIVLKADGLAAGKGVLIIDTIQEAQNELRSMLEGKFGEASSRVVVEEFLSGIEFSVFAVSDGISYKILPEAKDYKRIGEGDSGLNTGGMGAISPVPFADDILMQKVLKKIIAPTFEGLQKEGIEYIGFLFFGLINVGGEPYVIEYNCRMGDPETEVVLPRLETDLLEICKSMADKKLSNIDIKINTKTAATVFLVSGGYPDDYEKGKVISIPNELKNSILFHAGTRRNEKNELLTNGGRVIAVTSLGNDISEAVKISNSNAELIHFQDKYFRKDIGKDLL